ncbi:MAG: 1-acyl-sn-glycerol-3-phosphate acyltransferase [Acidobacteriota bacterium]|nr:1-acyl-sn-glycerol-3-phosphate acyltransferase [Acidobacteriota bacterium]
MTTLRALLFTDPAIIVMTIVMGTISLITSLFDSTGRKQHRLARLWSRILLRISGIRAESEGVGRLDPARGYVLAANHCSYMDTPLVLATIPLEFRFFAKKGLFLIPLMGTHLYRAGHIPVVRDNPRASIKSMAEGARLIRERGISVLLFPEGGRNEGELREFKEGAAYVAIKAGVPIVPMGIVGTREVLPIHDWLVRPGTVRLVVGEPIPTAGLTVQDRGDLTGRLREAIAALIDAPS